jgi:nucleotide-binding universal stress UspA family protein
LSLSIKKILVTIDGSESSKKAAEYAISLAKKYNAQLFILYVLYSELGFAYSNLLGVTTPKAIKDVLETQKKDVQKWFNEIKINSKPPIFLWLTKSLFQHHQLLVKLWDLLTKKK